MPKTEIIPITPTPVATSPSTSPPVKKKVTKTIFKIFLNIFSVIFILATLIAVFGFFFVFVPGKQLYDQVISLNSDVNELKQAVTDKNLVFAKDRLTKLKNQIPSIQKSYSRLSLIGSFPYIQDYYQDGNRLIEIAKDGLDTGEIVITAVEPYQDFLGLKGAATSSGKTTEDRITFLTQSIEGLLPHLNTIESKVSSIEDNLNKIDSNRYPEEFRGYIIKSNLTKLKTAVADGHKLLKNGQPILNQTAWLLGKDKPRNYFLIFQNDGELRPTGGFWTAYGILKVDKGKITPVISDDIYALDAKFNSKIPAPRPIKDYHLNVPYYNIRDMNINPDFPTSAKLLLESYQKATGSKEKIDAVVAIDTQVLVGLVKNIGRVGVFGWGNFSAEPDKRCDGCPQIIYQLEWIAGRPRAYIETDRKGFLAPLMQSLLSNAMGAEKSKVGPLVQTLLNNVLEKHILFYFTDPKIQSAGILANIGGDIVQTPAEVDYVSLIDANMSSAKTNLFLNQKIKHEIISHDGKVEHKISVYYINPSKASNCNLEKGDLCLNAPKYRDWFRFYVPTGSELVKMTGSEVDPVKYEESGKQVFEGFYGNKYPLYAQSSLKTSIQYFSSIRPGANYTLYLQKQAGTKPVDYELIVNGQKTDSFSWVSDRTIKLSL